MQSARKKRQNRSAIFLAAIVFFALVLGIVVTMNVKNTTELQDILRESIKSQLLSIAVAAQEIIDPDAFAAYNSREDVAADQAAYDMALLRLRTLRENVGAMYIYALKQIDGAYYFIFDTDTVENAYFEEYPLSPVHESAFLGKASVDISNVTDAFGSFNTAAVPIWQNGKIVGIICADIEDTFLKQSDSAATMNIVILVVTLVITMAITMYAIFMLLKRVHEMQARLERIAHYDTVTGLPNRQYLLDHLASITTGPDKTPFALLFIDLDNFKKVNDNAGHDAGDALLRHIANYLEVSQDNAMSFRPAAGILNIAARIGGDEFVQIVSGIKNEAEASVFAQRLLDMFASQTTDRYIDKYGVGLSIGVALFPYHSDNLHVLIKYADVAMYQAKKSGKNCFRVYNDEMNADGDQV